MGRRIALGVAGVLVVAGIASAAIAVTGRPPSRQASIQAPAAGGPAVVLASPAADATDAAARALLAPAPPPATLVIPTLGVRAVVEAVGTDAQGRMAVPSRADHVAWFSPGPAPGDAGDAVIDGHLDWTTGPAVFWLLGRLRPGDEVDVLRADGSQARFQVDATRNVPFDAKLDDLFTRVGPPSLSLVTCSGSWDRRRGTYLDRLLVHTTLIPAAPHTPPGDEGG